jgi:hypothetical protein
MSTFSGYLLKATLVVAAVTAAAAWPVHAWAGERGLTALLVASAVGLVGAVLGRVPHLVFTRGPDAIFHASMAGLGLRLLGTLAIAAPIMMLSGLPLMPFALGLVLAYFSLLILEVRDLVVMGRAVPRTDGAVPAPGTANPDGVPTR